MNPIAFTIPFVNLAIHWYGIIMVTGIVAGTWIAAHEVHWRGEDSEHVWNALTWAMPAGVVGARLWYVVNDMLGGNTRYFEHPISIINTREGGLHFYGAILFGALVAYIYARKYKLDMRLLLDAVAPVLLISQAIIRPANFINQELYGQPTDLPWGIPISTQHRIPPWNDLNLYPEDTTRFHPTFAYEIAWNLLAAGLLLWASRRFAKKLKPGTVFAGWLVLAGVGRVIIECFRPDQPRVPGTDISYTRIVAVLMAIAGIVDLLVKYEVIRLPFLSPGPASYAIAPSEPAPSEPTTEASG